MNHCPICSNTSLKKFLAKVNLIYNSEYDLIECTGCKVICFNPMPMVDQLETFYNSSYYTFEKSREEGKGMAFAKRLNKWKPKGKFLDVGCATGFFINGIKKHSEWEVYGTDFGKSAVKYAKENLNLDVRHGELSEVNFPESYFDYVHVNNVLEHVIEPLSLLKEVRRLIKPDGIFYLSVPNGYNDSLDLIEFYKQEIKPARSKNGHIFFFPKSTILKLLNDSGFIVETKKTYNFKRGFRSIGYLPRKKSWKKDYYPKTEPEKSGSSDIVINEKKKHSDFYYRYKFFQDNLFMVSGLYNFGLDFLFISKPKNT